MSCDQHAVRVAVFFADGLEEVEGLSVVDILYRANIACDIVSITAKHTVVSAHEVTIGCSVSIYDEGFSFDEYDMLVLPGGIPGTPNLKDSGELCDALLRFAADDSKAIAAICAAPSVLGDLGLLRGVHAVSHPSFQQKIKDAGAVVDPDKKVVIDGAIITSQGAATALDFGLAIAEYFKGPELAQSIASGIVKKDF